MLYYRFRKKEAHGIGATGVMTEHLHAYEDGPLAACLINKKRQGRIKSYS